MNRFIFVQDHFDKDALDEEGNLILGAVPKTELSDCLVDGFEDSEYSCTY